MKAVAEYLRISEVYCHALNGLHWSPDGEAIEDETGKTVAFSTEIVSFLEGFASRQPLIDFNHILHLLYLLHRPWQSGATKLQDAFHLAGRVHRNAGAFCAALCTNVPAAVDPPPTLAIWQQVVLRWYRIMEALAADGKSANVPPLPALAFEKQILTAAAAYTPEELLHWFKYGTGPAKDAGAAIVQQVVETKPRSLKGVFSELALRDRLSGAVPFVSQMVSALTLPPRRLVHHELPIGGYADVTTTGQPDQLLPSQFALDDLEFLRRFAERELLYFRREEPHSRTREELVVLLDQGVRTWGIVRIVLTAAVFAFARMADRRRLPFLLASTSANGAVFDPLQTEQATIARCIEASDLSANPGLALERVLQDHADTMRDVVLLTHPRNLKEEDVAISTIRADKSTRLFAVAVTEHGDVDFSELKRGVPLKISQFHVNLKKGEPPPARPNVIDSRSLWHGDVEPVGFPFRFGITSNKEPFHFDLDCVGKHLLTASANGMLHAVRTDGSGFEVLPRAMVDIDGKAVLNRVDCVLGVADGFVVIGTIRKQLVIAHYDFGQRSCKAYTLGEANWLPNAVYYYRDLHTLVALQHYYGVAMPCAIDLSTCLMERISGSHSMTLQESAASLKSGSRPRQACMRALNRDLPTRQLDVTGDSTGASRHKRADISLDLLSEHGDLMISSESGHAKTCPVVDGQPLWKGHVLLRGLYTNQTLILSSAENRGKQRCKLAVLTGPAWNLAAEYDVQKQNWGAALSSDGQVFARQVLNTGVEVRHVADPSRIWACSLRGLCHNNIVARLGDRWLVLEMPKVIQVFEWQSGTLRTWQNAGTYDRNAPLIGLEPSSISPLVNGHPACLCYDPNRFRKHAVRSLIAVCDEFGQVIVLDRTGELVCMFFAFRKEWAAWMPDGTRLGSARLGGPATPDAETRIGRALLEASLRGERSKQ